MALSVGEEMTKRTDEFCMLMLRTRAVVNLRLCVDMLSVQR